MKTAVEHYDPLPQDMLRELSEMQAWLASVPDPQADVHPDRLWSCHAVVRAVAEIWRLDERGWTVVDGHFHRHYQHSWLERGHLILDAYPVGSCGGPILLARHVWGQFFMEDADRFAARQENFAGETRKLVAAAADAGHRPAPAATVR